MTSVDPADLFVVDAAPRLGRGAVRAVGYADACLRRIDERDGAIGAFELIDPDLVRHRARDLDSHRLSGSPIGALHGVPVAVQDILDTADLPTGNGTAMDAGRRPTRDAAAVARLRGAGALILGKTATTELGLAGPVRTCNPADTGRCAAGPAGGTAAAVASGMVPLAVAVQTAGDIIQAASSCGVVGFKPSHGLMPSAGALPRSEPLDTVGVFARCVEDAALAADALAAPGTTGLDAPFLAFPRALELARSEPPLTPSFAYVPQAGWGNLSPAVAEGFSELEAALGDRWETVELPDTFADGIGAHRTLMLVDVAHHLGRYLDRGGDRLGAAPRAVIAEGRNVPAVNYLSALDWREVLYTGVERVFSRFEVIVTPAAAGEAPAAGEPADNPAFCVLWTLLGLPAVSLPLMEGPNGLPVGVQLVGRRGQDGRLLRTARWLVERVSGRA